MSNTMNTPDFNDALEIFRAVGRDKKCKVLGIFDERGTDCKYEWFAFFRTDDWKDGGTAGLVDMGNVDFAPPENPSLSVFDAYKRLTKRAKS